MASLATRSTRPPFQHAIAGADTYVHLVGTNKPAPWKEEEFRAVDPASLIASAAARKRWARRAPGDWAWLRWTR
ncbi:MAG: hypothetical protein HY235_16450 [Acidobacteria bacterium]|nr:hypothetical protein [Acidobacteriota bacterium]